MRFHLLTPALMQRLALRPVDVERFSDPRVVETICAGRHGRDCEPGAWAALEGETVLGAGGVLPLAAGRGLLWLAPGMSARPRHLVRALPFMDAWLERLLRPGAFRRIEATVVAGFVPGCRLLDRLGFLRETPEPMRRYGVDGEDHYLFARVMPP